MPKSKPFLSLPSFMASGPLQSVTQKQLFGGQYVRLGDFLTVLAFVYEHCALLGRMFKDDVASLAPLLANPGDEEQFVAFCKEKAEERLGRYRLIYGEYPDLLDFLVLATEYEKFGLIIPHGNVGSMEDLKRAGRAA